MADLYTPITEQARDALAIIPRSLNLRASDPAMQAICARYMGQISVPEGGRVLEVGCGNGAATRLVMQHVDPAQLVGIDPSPVFIDMARDARRSRARGGFHS